MGLGPEHWKGGDAIHCPLLSESQCCRRKGGAQEQKTGLGLGSEVGDIISRKE